MKRQNSSSSASPHPNHNRGGGERSDNELIMMTPPASSSAYNRLGSPYGGNNSSSVKGGGGGRRRKLIHSTDRQLQHHHRDANTATATSTAAGGSLANSTSNNTTNSTKGTPKYDNFEINSFLNLLNNNNHHQQQQQQNEEESDDEVSKKRKKPSATLFTTPATLSPLFTTTTNACTTTFTTTITACTNTISKLQTTLYNYRKKLSNLSPRQKIYMCGIILLWKFIQAWLILRVFVWLGAGGGGGVGVGAGGGVNSVGRSMEQRMELDQQLQREINLSLVEEGRLNDGNKNDNEKEEEEESSRLWLDMMGENDGVQQNEEVMLEPTATTRMLYMVTVTCNLQSYNINTTTTTNLDDILSTLSSNIQTMIVYPEYTVDVYWIMGCSSSSLGSAYYTTTNNNINLSDRKEEKAEKESSSAYWKSYISQHLPSGVGLEIWEDAMPLDYSLLSSRNQQQQSQQQLQKRRRRLEEDNVVKEVQSLKATTSPLHSKAQFNKSTKKKQQEGSKVLQHESINNNDINDGNIILSPSIEKFMKQHRYVVRDKLEYYDVFLSFGTSLQHHDPQSSNSNSSVNNISKKRQQHGEEVGERITLNNGTTIPYCKQKLYQETTDIHCNERVEYMMKRYHMSDVEAKISLLEKKECICRSSSGSDTSDGNGGDASSQATSSSSSQPSYLERITGDHIYAYLTLSSELNKLRTQGLIIPGFMSVGVVPTTAAAVTTAKDDSRLQQFDIDALPCCNDSAELTIETRKTGATIDTNNYWQIVKTVGDSNEVVATDNKDDEGEFISPPSPEWVAIEVKSADNAIPAFSFYEDGWILTKEQLLHLDYGNNRGKFLPPFLDGYRDNNIAVDKKKKAGLASPLFEAREKGGFGVRRAISLDKSTFSKQLVLRRSRASTSKRPNASSTSAIGVRELLLQFHNAKEKKEQ
jgi:hypothetical protein